MTRHTTDLDLLLARELLGRLVGACFLRRRENGSFVRASDGFAKHAPPAHADVA